MRAKTITPTNKQLLEALSGKNPKEIEEYLTNFPRVNLQEIANAVGMLMPEWVSKMRLHKALTRYYVGENMKASSFKGGIR